MIIRGKWRMSWRAVKKLHDKLTRHERLKYRAQLLLVLPVCAVYWVMFTASEGLLWASDKLSDAGDWIYDRIWEG
jgi:hypothetical protein